MLLGSEACSLISHTLRNPTLDKTSAHVENMVLTVENELHKSIQLWLADYIGTSVKAEVSKLVSMSEDNDSSENTLSEEFDASSVATCSSQKNNNRDALSHVGSEKKYAYSKFTGEFLKNAFGKLCVPVTQNSVDNLEKDKPALPGFEGHTELLNLGSACKFQSAWSAAESFLKFGENLAKAKCRQKLHTETLEEWKYTFMEVTFNHYIDSWCSSKKLVDFNSKVGLINCILL